MTNRNENNGYRWNYEEYSTSTDNARTRVRTNTHGLKVFLVLLAVIVVVSCMLCIGIAVISSRNKVEAEPPITSVPGGELENLPEINQENKPGDTAPEQTESGLLTPAGIYKKCKDSVVGVLTYGAESSQGSGIILSADGYVITNAHVVSGGESFDVVLNDGTYCVAELVGADDQTDLALLRILKCPENLSPATFGNSDELEVGEMVVAIGNPSGLALASTQTVGYVSAVERTITTEMGYSMVCIQADVAINPGNSGGPLINTYGQVIGITSSKLVEEGYEGIGFSIPINEALPILDELMANGKVTGRAKLGIMASSIDEEDGRYYGLPTGLLIRSITEGADIGEKGVRAGDIITAIAGVPVKTFGDVTSVLADYKPGDTVTVTVFRPDNSRGEVFEVDVILSGS